MVDDFTYIENLDSLIENLPPDSILSRNVYQDKSLKTILFGFRAGQELSEHTASVPAILQFLRGEALVILGEETRPAQKGTWIHLPAHLPHSIQAESETLMLLTLIL